MMITSKPRMKRSHLNHLWAKIIVLTGLFGLMTACGGDSDPTSPGGGNETPVVRWQWQNPLPQGNGLHEVFFTDTNMGTAVGSGGIIMRTTDGGATWEIQKSGTQAWLGIRFKNH